MGHRICFLSDIHWRGSTRHAEYTYVFSRLFAELREVVKPDSIIVGGDIFHTKTLNITPEVIDKIRWMFEELSAIAPVYSILGNHDGNLENNTRQDTITPIVTAMDNPRIKLFKRSGNFIIPGTMLNLCVLSPFDTDGWGMVQEDDDLVNIALFHGSVRGCSVDSDWVMSGTEVNLDMFQKYDFAFLGDIHKQQFLDYRSHGGVTRELRPWIGYPGSLIQQNYGELEHKGYHVWDIQDADNWNVEFRTIDNPYRFITVPWQGDVNQTVDVASEMVDGALENKRVRIASDETVFSLYKKELSETLKTKYGCSEVVYKTAKTTAVSAHDGHKSAGKDKSLRNDPEHICSLFEDFVGRDYKGTLSDVQTSEAKDYIRSSLKTVRDGEEDDVRDVVWSLRNLEFSNLYRYGANNCINFDNLQGIVGLFAENQMGKSSVVGSLMFSLFNTTDRGPVKSSYIINKNERWGEAKAIVNVGGVDYVVQRTVEKAKRRGGLWDDEKAATKLVLSKVISTDGETIDLSSENGETRTDTDKILRKLIGTAQDFMLTSLSSQEGMHKFINEGSTQRKAILNRFLDIDVFEKLFKLANEDLTAINIKASRWQGQTNWEVRKLALQGELEQLQTQVSETTARKHACQQERDLLRLELEKKSDSSILELEQQVKRLSKEHSSLDLKLKEETANLDNTKRQLTTATQRFASVVEELSSLDHTSLTEKKERLDKLTVQHGELKAQAEREQAKLEQLKRSVKKLDVVPCGDQFQSCLYIKDSHADKQLLGQQQSLAASIVEAFDSLKTEFDTLVQENVQRQLAQHDKLAMEKQGLQTRIESLETVCSTMSAVVSDLQTKTVVAEQHRNTAKQELEAKMSQNAIQEDKDKLKAAEINLSQLENELVKLYKLIGARTASQEELQKDEQEAAALLHRQRVLDSIVQAFSKTGIPAAVLKHKLPEINSELENILAGVVPFRVYLKAESDSNNLDVFIEDKDSTRIIELASGMEKVISSLALRVALITLSSLPKPDMFIVDEGWGALSPANRGRAIELLNTLKSRFRLVLVISHVDEIKEAANTIITIKDVDGRSSINW
jgi:exonuclease SbcC